MGIFKRLLTLLLLKLLYNRGVIFINKKVSYPESQAGVGAEHEALRAEMLWRCIRAALAGFNLTGKKRFKVNFCCLSRLVGLH